jgi:hypothetical protein
VLRFAGLDLAGVELLLILAALASRRSLSQLIDASDELCLRELFVVGFAHLADLRLRSLVQSQEESEFSEVD